ncbi:MAG: hypothetical protein WBV82_13555 [Myxococcaceae bacterium]
MKRQVLTGLLAFGVLSGCGQQPSQTPDAGEPVDTSCGIDCAAQEKYGLIANRCFEYSASNNAQAFPEVGAFVRPVRELEGGVKVMPVEYRKGGLILMTDNFAIKDGGLYLARREFKAGQSVTYKDGSNAIVGVPWFYADTEVKQNFSSNATADVVDGGQRNAIPTTYTVNTDAPTNLEKIVPSGTFDDAIKLTFSESPDHGADGKRVLAPGTGFILFSTNFELSSTANRLPHFLQTVRDIAEGDVDCGIGQ